MSKNADYNYAAKRTKGKIRIISVGMPEGPITFRRYNPAGGKTIQAAKDETISTALIWRVANAASVGQPINLDRVLGGSYNTRSVLEALLANTPEFSMCRPGRVHQAGPEIKIELGHKHIWWRPDAPHRSGVIEWIKTEIVVSEVPVADATYDALPAFEPIVGVPEGVQRRHSLTQISLIEIGKALGFQTSVAIEDRHINYRGKRLAELEGVVRDLSELSQVRSYPLAVDKLKHVDVAWFKNGKLMPAAIEIEHTTGIKSGLDRLRALQDEIPQLKLRYVIAADSSDRERVVKLANEKRFRSLDIRFFPYSAIDELYALCQRRKLVGVDEDFIDTFMERTIA